MNNQEIGQNAGFLWQIFDNKGKIQISELQKIAELSFKDFYLALGWLTRGNNIKIYEKNLQSWICLLY